eukprot:COSAG02_NODE_29638_length_565_cov_2.396996_1_plen_72_part_00
MAPDSTPAFARAREALATPRQQATAAEAATAAAALIIRFHGLIKVLWWLNIVDFIKRSSQRCTDITVDQML